MCVCVFGDVEALDMAYQDKEELIVENELQKDDNEKLLGQYEREKQARKDTELVRQLRLLTHPQFKTFAMKN